MNVLKNTFTILVFVIMLAAGFFGLNSEALAQESCDLTIRKSSDPAIDTEFIFTIASGDISFQLPLRDPSSDQFQTGLPPGDSVSITEEPLEGWELVGIQCTADDAVDYSIEGSTLTISCINEGGEIACVFSNALNQAEVPTLSEWGLISMAGILGLVGFMVVRRRKATA